MERNWDNVSEWAYDPLNERWALLRDMNRDGIFSISDIGSWVGYGFFAPGDGVIYLALSSAPGLATFLEYTVADYGGFSSGVISTLTWLIYSGAMR